MKPEIQRRLALEPHIKGRIEDYEIALAFGDAIKINGAVITLVNDALLAVSGLFFEQLQSDEDDLAELNWIGPLFRESTQAKFEDFHKAARMLLGEAVPQVRVKGAS